MEPCIFRMPFPSYFTDSDEATLLANVKAFFAPKPAITPLPRNPASAAAQEQTLNILDTYDFAAFEDPQRIRNFVTNLLLNIAATGKTEAAQLRAVEMLGKVKDVALFEERSTVLVEHMTTDEIKQVLAQKVQRLREKTLDAQTVEITTTKEPQ